MPTEKQVLIIDDEPDIRELLSMTLEQMNINCHPAENVRQAKHLLSQQAFDLCLTDMRLPDGNGIELVRHIQSTYPDTPVAVITAYGSTETAVASLKAGAFDFISKPVVLDNLRSLVTSALKLGKSTTDTTLLTEQTLIGASVSMERLRQIIYKVARSQAPVQIRGQTGTGKELVARLIHAQSNRHNQPFIPVNCGAIPSELLESEFFGHRRGSFTGAVADKNGLFQAAHGGTLFLDEIADLPLAMQVKLLRAIQEKTIRPIGEHREIAADVRILSATHKNLAEMVRTANFREDLYFRLNVIEIEVPSLKERREDIPELVQHFLTRLQKERAGETVRIAVEALAHLRNYDFPGNIRELENILERALTLCENNQIRQSDLQLIPRTREEQGSSMTLGKESLNDYLQRQEIQAIKEAMRQTNGNKTAAARLLGISFRALRYKLEKNQS